MGLKKVLYCALRIMSLTEPMWTLTKHAMTLITQGANSRTRYRAVRRPTRLVTMVVNQADKLKSDSYQLVL